MVVLPACVAPLTRIFAPAETSEFKKSQTSVVRTPSSTKSFSSKLRSKCLRILTAQCSAVISGIVTCNLEPSGSRASTKGCERSKRRPLHIRARSTIFLTSSPVSSRFVSSLRPFRATKIRSGELIQISSILESLIKGKSGP